MRVSSLAPLALTALLVTGCRSGGNQELIERELRFQETELYRLHDELDSARADLESAWRENEALKKELATGDTGAAPPAGAAPGSIPLPAVELPPGIDSTPPASARPSHMRRPKGKPSTPEVGVPMIEPGIEVSPGGPALPEMTAPEVLPPLGAKRGKVEVRGVSHNQPATVDRRVLKIVLNRQLTGGRDSDGRHGDEAVTVVFEPRNAAGQLLKIPGEVSIVVLDAAQSGAAARVARWDFKPTEAVAHFRSSGTVRGYYFELPWPGPPPVHSSLELFVRLKTADGKRFIANQTIQVDPSAGLNQERLAVEEGDVPAGSGPGSRVGDATQAAARDGLRPRLFSHSKQGSAASPAETSPAPPVVGGTLEVTVPGGVVGDNGKSYVLSDDSPVSKSSRLIDRSKLRGGPGVFDGSRLRNLTGSRDSKSPDGSPYRSAATGGNDGGEAPAYRASSPTGSSAAPRIEIQEPMGGLSSSEDGPQVDMPDEPPARTARPVWKPYR